MFMTEPQPNHAFEWTQARWGPVLRCVPLDDVAPHLFTIGNLRLDHESDEWRLVADWIGIAHGGLRLIRQVHGVAVAHARKGDSASWTTPEADVVITDDGEVAVGVRIADCAPVLIADRRLPVVAAAHAGWRGTLRNAPAEAVRALCEEYGSNPHDLVAAIGPCLGPCCGEVGIEVVEAFRAAGHDSTSMERWFAPGPRGRPHLDLWQANRDQLQRAGLTPGNIFAAELCTRTHAPLFHSYRGAGEKAGRMVAAIRVRRGS
jgi:YfiH family protein